MSKSKHVDDGHRLYMTGVMSVPYLLKEAIWIRSTVPIIMVKRNVRMAEINPICSS